MSPHGAIESSGLPDRNNNMNILTRLNIGPRLGVAFASIVLIAVVVVAVGISRMSFMNDDTAVIGSQLVPKLKTVNDIDDGLNAMAREMRNALVFDDPAVVSASLAAVTEASASNGKLLHELSSRLHSERERKQFDELTATAQSYGSLEQEFVALARKGDRSGARALLAERLFPLLKTYTKSLKQLTDDQVDLVRKTAEDVEAAFVGAKWLMIALAAAMAAGSALLAWLITRSITVPMQRAVQVAEAVAGGDLGSRIEVSSRDEAGRLLGALRAMNENLARLVSEVRTSAESIATGSSQVATGSADLSQRTEEQAANVQQTAASMEQLGTTVTNNAETARTAAQLAQSASGVATQGGQVVGQVVATMDEISASSRRIADIIGVIDGIAFQTNILALNAAVEAARAGEQGRGFAVVAGEVRTLAQRSAEAAREIKSLIGASVEKVASGSGQVATAGRTMSEIVAQVQRVSDLIAEISAASTEQTQGIGQVGDAVSQMDQVTQQNAALVEESAAAADSLRQQAQRLVQAVSAFRLAA